MSSSSYKNFVFGSNKIRLRPSFCCSPNCFVFLRFDPKVSANFIPIHTDVPLSGGGRKERKKRIVKLKWPEGANCRYYCRK